MERLEIIAMNDEVWSAAAIGVAVGGANAREQIQAAGHQIVECVVAGRLAVDDLRSCVRWTSMLAQEAATAAEQGAKWSDEERLEVAARQILHGSVSIALNKVRTEDRLLARRVLAARSNFA